MMRFVHTPVFPNPLAGTVVVVVAKSIFYAIEKIRVFHPDL